MAQRKAGREAAIQAKKPKRRKRPTNPEFKGEGRTLSQDLLHLRKRKRLEKELKDKYDEAREARVIFERYVLDRMEFEGVSGQKADHTNFVPTRTIYAQVLDKAKFIAWAQENDPELLKPDEIRDGELNGLVRRLIDDGENLPPGVDFHVREYISTKAA